jgi:hypothetical protein
LVLLLAACGGEGGREPTPEHITPEYDDSAGALIVEVDTYGGLVPAPSSRHVAELSIYGEDRQVALAEEDTAPRGGTDRSVTVGRISEQQLADLLASIADSGFFGLEDRDVDPAAPTDGPWRHVTVNVLDRSKTVSVYPPAYATAPDAFWETYDAISGVQPSELTAFVPTSGTLTSTDLGPVEDFPGGQANQVAPWDTPLWAWRLASFCSSKVANARGPGRGIAYWLPQQGSCASVDCWC